MPARAGAEQHDRQHGHHGHRQRTAGQPAQAPAPRGALLARGAGAIAAVTVEQRGGAGGVVRPRRHAGWPFDSRGAPRLSRRSRSCRFPRCPACLVRRTATVGPPLGSSPWQEFCAFWKAGLSGFGAPASPGVHVYPDLHAAALGRGFDFDPVFAHALGELLHGFFLFHLLLRGEVQLLGFGPVASAGLLGRFHRSGTAARLTGADLEAVTAARVRDGFGVDAVFAQALGEVGELHFGLLFLGLRARVCGGRRGAAARGQEKARRCHTQDGEKDERGTAGHGGSFCGSIADRWAAARSAIARGGTDIKPAQPESLLRGAEEPPERRRKLGEHHAWLREARRRSSQAAEARASAARRRSGRWPRAPSHREPRPSA